MTEQLAFTLEEPPRAKRERTPRPANGRRVKQKGSAYERRVAELLRSIWPEAWRGDQRSPYFRCPDVDGTPLWVEAKAGKRVNLQGAWKQAERDQAKRGGSYRFPIVIAKNDREPDLALLRLADLLPMLAAWWKREGVR